VDAQLSASRIVLSSIVFFIGLKFRLASELPRQRFGDVYCGVSDWEYDFVRTVTMQRMNGYIVSELS
jgi:hypothetical protein